MKYLPHQPQVLRALEISKIGLLFPEPYKTVIDINLTFPENLSEEITGRDKSLFASGLIRDIEAYGHGFKSKAWFSEDAPKVYGDSYFIRNIDLDSTPSIRFHPSPKEAQEHIGLTVYLTLPDFDSLVTIRRIENSDTKTYKENFAKVIEEAGNIISGLDFENFYKLSNDSKNLIKQAYHKLTWTPGTVEMVIKVAGVIAVMEYAQDRDFRQTDGKRIEILEEHVAEAIQYFN